MKRLKINDAKYGYPKTAAPNVATENNERSIVKRTALFTLLSVSAVFSSVET